MTAASCFFEMICSRYCPPPSNFSSWFTTYVIDSRSSMGLLTSIVLVNCLDMAEGESEGEVVVFSTKHWNCRNRVSVIKSVWPLVIRLKWWSPTWAQTHFTWLSWLQSQKISPLPHNTFNYTIPQCLHFTIAFHYHYTTVPEHQAGSLHVSLEHAFCVFELGIVSIDILSSSPLL